jgi:hypothetical protein
VANRIGSVTTLAEYVVGTTSTFSGLAVPAGLNRCVAVLVATSNPALGAVDVVPGATCDTVAMEALAADYPVASGVAQTKLFGLAVADGDSAVDIVVTFAGASCARVIFVIFLENVDPADLADAVTSATNGGGSAIATVTVAEDDTANGYVLAWCHWRNATALTCASTGEGTEIGNLTIDQGGSTNYDTGLAAVESTGDASVIPQWTASGTITMEARGLRFNHLLGSGGGGGGSNPAGIGSVLTKSKLAGELRTA